MKPTDLNYRHDLLRWRRKLTGDSYQDLADISGLSRTTLCDTVRGVIDPSASTIKKTYKALGLDPKYALDFSLRKSEFPCAVIANGSARG